VTGSRRGLTILGAALLVLILGTVGVLADLILSGQVGLMFGIGFVVGCLLAAGRVHQEDLAGVVVMPPLAYAAITLVVGFIHPAAGGSGAGLKNKAIDIGSELVLKAPILIVGVVIVIVIVLNRARRVRAARRERAVARERAQQREYERGAPPAPERGYDRRYERDDDQGYDERGGGRGYDDRPPGRGYDDRRGGRGPAPRDRRDY
jgi:lysylphosphatidylglycerol synthetase-like protein (DUF2156 family)